MKKPSNILAVALLVVALATPVLLLANETQSAKPASAMSAEESAFLGDNEGAMTKMMNGMAARPAGDIDRDFVAMMSPHHQGAIDMAVIYLRYGKNEQLRRIAQEIVVDQTQEIGAMKLAIGEPVTDTSPAPTQQQPAAPGSDQHHSGMPMDMPAATKK
jgi:uncharacterized protein (DUF305 family)